MLGTPGCWGVEEGLEPLGGRKGLGPWVLRGRGGWDPLGDGVGKEELGH